MAHNSPQGPYSGHHRGPPPMPPHHPNGHPHPHQPSKSVPELLIESKEEIYMRMGRLWEIFKDEEVALQSYNCALKNNTACVPAMMAIANMLKERDQYGPAIEYYRNITKYDEGNGEVWANLGHCYLMVDSLSEAYHAYQTALYHLQDLSQPRLWYGIGILYDRYGSLEHAEEAFSQVMRMAPDFEKANEIYFRLGIIYKQQQKFSASLDCFRYIVSNPPKPLTEEDIWFQLGHVYEQQKDYTSAKDAYKRVLERDPKHAKVLQQLGWLHHQQSNDYQNQEQAIQYLEQSVASDQNDAQSWYLLGRCYMAQNKYPSAYEAYQQAVYRDGRNPTFWCSIGVLYYQINQYRDALDAYSRAIRLNPNISEVWYDLGTLYESCNNQTADALDAYQRAAELDPTNIHIKARLDLLRRGQENGAPNPGPQELHPQAYQPAAITGPPQPQWGTTGPAAHAPPRGQAPELDYSNRLSGIQSHPPQGPQQVPTYEHREGHPQHLPGPPKPPSPRQEQPRHFGPPGPHYPGEPHPQRRSPSPKSRNPQQPFGHAGSASHPPPPPPPHLQQHQPQGHAPAPTRITNPNYESHGPPQHHVPPPGPPAPHSHGYNRSPGPDSRLGHENRPGSTGAGLFPPPPPHHRSTPSHPSQGPPPQGEPHREREESSRTPIPKRHREWDENPNSAKSQHHDEKRPRLDEDSRLPSIQHAQPLPSPPRPYGANNGEPQHQPRSDEGRRVESYHPSDAAHHPPSQHHQGHPPPTKPQQTPPQRETANPPPPPPNFPPQSPSEPPRPKESPPHIPQEPAARKMEVDENYDDEEEEKKPNGSTKRESPHAERDGMRHDGPIQEGKVEA